MKIRKTQSAKMMLSVFQFLLDSKFQTSWQEVYDLI